MKTDARNWFGRIVWGSSTAFLMAGLVSIATAQDSPSKSENTEAAKAKAKEKIQSAQESKQGAREDIRDTREGVRDTAREDRQTTRDAREGGRDTVRDDRHVVRDARREGMAARREFIAGRIRSGDLGLWLRQMSDGLKVSDVANRGVIAQSGLKEGDEIVSVNGQPVTTEREFVDHLFADQDNKKPAQVVIERGGKQQTIALQTKPFVDEHLAGDNRLHDFGLIMDEGDANHVKVQAVVPRSPAFYAGVRSGDQITGFNGQRINAVKDLVSTLANVVGQTTSVEVKRNNQPKQLDIDVPQGEQGDQSRTALKPVLPGSNAIAPAQPQAAPRIPAGTQPRLNKPQ